MILFLVNKQTMISDIVINSGISQRNFWFEYFMKKFSSCLTSVDTFEELIVILQSGKKIDRVKLIVQLKNEFEITGEYFDNFKIFALEKSIFQDIDLTKMKSRKIKVIEV